jgi:molybdate transport system substrate-binding protein
MVVRGGHRANGGGERLRIGAVSVLRAMPRCWLTSSAASRLDACLGWIIRSTWSGAVICRELKVHALVFCVAAALLSSVAASADEVKVMISGGFASAYRALGPQFEEAVGNTLVTVWGPVVGTAANAIPMRLARGEWADVLIVVGYALDDQINAGKVVSGSKVDFARSAIGIAAREGAPKADISSVDALRRTLLAAKSIVYPDDANGVYNGEAELGFQQIVELLPVNGVTVVGSLPAEVQRYTVFSGGIATNAKNPAGAAALILFLSSPAAAPAIEGTGLEPLTPKTAN